MEDANICITNVVLTPNPVEAGKQFIISVTINDIAYVIGNGDYAIGDKDSKLIQVPYNSKK